MVLIFRLLKTIPETGNVPKLARRPRSKGYLIGCHIHRFQRSPVAGILRSPSVPADADAPNIWPVRLMHVFHLLGVFASGDFRSVLGSKAAIAFQHGVVGIADFV